MRCSVGVCASAGAPAGSSRRPSATTTTSRVRAATCASATCEGGTGFGCSSNLSCDNTYYFSDAGVGEIGLLPQGCGTTSTVIPTGCYLPNTNGDPLSVFDGHEKGGCFTLHISDNSGADIGTVCEWSVFMLNEPVLPVEPATWGQIKTLHR